MVEHAAAEAYRSRARKSGLLHPSYPPLERSARPKATEDRIVRSAQLDSNNHLPDKTMNSCQDYVEHAHHMSPVALLLGGPADRLRRHFTDQSLPATIVVAPSEFGVVQPKSFLGLLVRATTQRRELMSTRPTPSTDRCIELSHDRSMRGNSIALQDQLDAEPTSGPIGENGEHHSATRPSTPRWACAATTKRRYPGHRDVGGRCRFGLPVGAGPARTYRQAN